MNRSKFDIILFLGRPAAGKSELIDYLKSVKVSQRKKIFHIAKILEIDDFKFLWNRCEADDRREKKGLPRKDSRRLKEGGYDLKSNKKYHELILDVNKEFRKNYNKEEILSKNTVFIEFSRGGKRGYRDSFKLLHKDILKQAVIFYVNCSYKESVRKNRRRFDPSKPDSILHHMVPERVMDTYKIDDWKDITSKDKGHIKINNYKVPYLVFNNEPEKTNNYNKIKKELLRSIDRVFKNIPKQNMSSRI